MALIEQIKDATSAFNRQPRDERLRALGARNLASEARRGKVQPAYAYAAYVDQALDSLGRAKGVLLLGPSGVGKTAILHEVVRRIVGASAAPSTATSMAVATPQAPDGIHGAGVYQISTSAIMSGCRYWGDWEAKIESMVAALAERWPTYLYIDNIWNLPQSGTNEHSSESLATIMQPLLERGELTLLGESTPENYRGGSRLAGRAATLQESPSLMRLLTTIVVEQPRPDLTRAIVASVARDLERARSTRVGPAVVERCVQLTERFERQRAQPGATIELLRDVVDLSHDVTAVRENRPRVPVSAQTPIARDAPYLEQAGYYEELALDYEQKARRAETSGAIQESRRTAVVAERGRIAREFRAIASTCLDWAVYTAQQADKGRGPLHAVSPPELAPQHEPPASTPTRVTLDDVLDVFARRTGLPTPLFSDSIPLRRAELLAYFAARVIGQNEAIGAVADRVLMIKAELNDPSRPLGVLFFGGPTGTGKTLLAGTLSNYVCGRDDALVRLDMSEYQDPTSAMYLADHLEERMGRRRFAVVLLDEIEKAAPTVCDLFLQAFDAGRLATSTGRVLDLRNSIFALTSNLGSDLGARGVGRPVGYLASGVGADGRETSHNRLALSVDAAVREHFRPELVNRLDRVVTFHALDRLALRHIARRELDLALARVGLRRRRITIDITDEVLDLLAVTGYHPDYGARPMQRAIEARVVLPVAEWIGADPARDGSALMLVVEGGRVAVLDRPPAMAADKSGVLAGETG